MKESAERQSYNPQIKREYGKGVSRFLMEGAYASIKVITLPLLVGLALLVDKVLFNDNQN